MALSFATDIRPLFREEDIGCMKSMGIDLDDPAWMCVPANAQDVYPTVSDGSMPPDEPWAADRVSLFKQWMDAGCPASAGCEGWDLRARGVAAAQKATRWRSFREGRRCAF
jgi:hypothetical protein